MPASQDRTKYASTKYAEPTERTPSLLLSLTHSLTHASSRSLRCGDSPSILMFLLLLDAGSLLFSCWSAPPLAADAQLPTLSRAEPVREKISTKLANNLRCAAQPDQMRSEHLDDLLALLIQLRCEDCCTHARTQDTARQDRSQRNARTARTKKSRWRAYCTDDAVCVTVRTCVRLLAHHELLHEDHFIAAASRQTRCENL